MKKITMIGIIFGVSLLTGCGGGSGGGSGVVAPTTRSMVTSTLRTFANGDKIQYSLTGSIAKGVAKLTLTGTGSLSMSINASPLDPTGIARSIQTLAFTGTLSSGAPFASSGDKYFSQNASGSINFYGDSASLWITIPASGFVAALKSPVISPDQWMNSYTQQNGDVTSQTITVIGKATVTIGMGTFETFKYQTDSTVTLAAGGTDVLTMVNYVVPSIGSIKTTIKRTSTDALGAVTKSQFTLVASTTNIPF